MPDHSLGEWLLMMIAAVCVGLSKSGLAGVSLAQILIFAFVFGAKASTGVLLPLLIVGDIAAVSIVGKDVLWSYVKRLLPPAFIGVVVGWALLGVLNENVFKPTIGWIILLLSITQSMRMWRPDLLADVPHNNWFIWFMGILSGVTTMLANAAGPLVAIYLLAVSLPKSKLIATAAWFFLIINVSKVPFSMQLALIDQTTLTLNLILAPMVVVGIVSGQWLVRKIPQRVFDSLLLAFTAIAALRMIGIF